MGAFLGHYEKQSRSALLEKGPAQQLVMAANVYPASTKISQQDWEAIKAYYLSEAPGQLPAMERKDSLQTRTLFKASAPKTRISPPMSTMVDFHPASGLIYHSDVKKDISTLNIFNTDSELLQAIALRSPAARIDEKGGALSVLTMGSFTFTDAPSGQLTRISRKPGSQQYNAVEVLINGLQRPTDLAYADFDQDGDEDVVIAQLWYLGRSVGMV